MRLAIIAGGLGKRLGYAEIPKPMVPIAGKPLLEHQIELARRYGITDIHILSGHLSEVIVRHFGDGGRWGVHLDHIVEQEPLGTAGAFKQLQDLAHERTMVFYGDTLMDIDLERFMEFDSRADSIGSLIVHPNDHPWDSDLLEVRGDRIVRFHPKPHPEGRYYANLVNAALYILSPRVFDYIPAGRVSDFGGDIFPALLAKGEVLRAYRTSEYLKDMGTADRLAKVERDVLSGRVSRFNRRFARKAIFLDRDGIINRDPGNISSLDKFELMPGVEETIRRINRSDFLAIVATNQPVVAKGFCTEEELGEIHKKMETLLGRGHAYLDGIYFCPHHPDKGFAGERPELKVDCPCRKPKPGMLLNAANDYNILLADSYFIGDRIVDVQAGRAAGVRTILISEDGQPLRATAQDSLRPDWAFRELKEAVDFILEQP